MFSYKGKASELLLALKRELERRDAEVMMKASAKCETLCFLDGYVDYQYSVN